ncbi:MAG TPA: hypothetical protein VF979_10125 [Streptosporangiaceae bacterium]
MTEAQLQSAVRRMCADLGLAVEHVEDSLNGRTWLPGMPDLTILGAAILYRELKNSGNSLSPKQRKVRAIIEDAGGDYATWRPMQLIDGTIARELTAISRLKIVAFTAAGIQRIEEDTGMTSTSVRGMVTGEVTSDMLDCVAGYLSGYLADAYGIGDGAITPPMLERAMAMAMAKDMAMAKNITEGKRP